MIILRKERIYLEKISSTNDYAAELLYNGDKNTRVIIASEQTCGHGRLGRKFYSPKDTGIYMSIIADIEEIKNLNLLTSLAGLSVCEGAEEIYPAEYKIKWPNDILVNGKKICGILTKLINDTSSQKISHAVIGIGVNVNNDKEDFPEDIRDIASSLKIETGIYENKSVLTEKILNKTDELIFSSGKNDAEALEKIKKRSLVIGRKVFVKNENREYLVKDISENGELIVDDADKNKLIFTGEIIL